MFECSAMFGWQSSNGNIDWPEDEALAGPLDAEAPVKSPNLADNIAFLAIW
jgi:hypothetical protein